MLKLFHKILTLLFSALLIGFPTLTPGYVDSLLFRLDSFKDPGSLAVKLQDGRAVVSKFIVTQLSAETQQLLSEYDGVSFLSPALQKALLADLNLLIENVPLYEAHRFADIQLSKQTKAGIAQNPQSGEALVHLNRLLLADTYPQELATHSERHNPEDDKKIGICRENFRQIKRALENYRTNTNANPLWLSELVPQYLDKNVLFCPSDSTAGVPGVLTDGAADPTLPCSYLYEFRPSEKVGQEFLLTHEGDMLPIVRCQHHLLNLSVSGKLYRNGPQRNIYFSNTTKITSVQLKASGDLHAQLRSQLGADFLKSPTGKDLLRQLAPMLPPSSNHNAKLINELMFDMVLTNMNGESVTLAPLLGKFVLVNVFSADCKTCGSELKVIENLLENYDAARLQAIGVSAGDSPKAIKEFREKYQISMPIWIDKESQILDILAANPQTGLITILLNPEQIVEEVFMDFDSQSLKQKIEQLVTPKN